MNKQRAETRLSLSEDSSKETTGTMSEVKTSRKQFVEPEVSDAIKVLKATQFFQQFSDNGNTGRPNG